MLPLGSLVWACVVVLGCLPAANARADQKPAAAHKQPAPTQTARTPTNVEDILPLANDPNDPIGLEREAEPIERAADHDPKPKATQRSSEDRERFGPEPPPMAARVGEVLTAVPTLQEKSQHAQLTLSQGLARVDVTLELENSADKPAELLYRLAVPDDAALSALEVCNVGGCRSGLVDPTGHAASAYDDSLQARSGGKEPAKLPLAHARKLHDARGAAFVLRAAPVSKQSPLTLHVSYVTNATQHGGVVRVRLPARGMDPRAARLELQVSTPGLTDVRVNDAFASSEALTFDAWSPIELSAHVAAGGSSASAWQFPCATTRCTRAYVAAGSQPLAPQDLVLAIDVSPSTEGPARSRLTATIAAILSAAPAGTRVRALMFAGRAQPLLTAATAADRVPLASFQQVGFEAELGSATRFEAAWQLISTWGASAGRLHRSVVIIGDGGLTTGPARAFEQARRAGVSVSVVNVADRPAVSALRHGAELTHGIVLDAGAEADDAVRGSGPQRLEERVSALFAATVSARISVSDGSGVHELGELRAGEALALSSLGAGKLNGVSRIDHALPRGLGDALGVLSADALGLRDARAELAAIDARDLSLHAHDRPEGQNLPPQKGHAADCDRRGPAQRHGGLSSDASPVVLASERALCAVPTPKLASKTDDDAETTGAGMPGSPLLSMLRQRIIPAARGCFRADRAGRPDYQVRAVFVFRLAEREVVSAEVIGEIAQELRQCLLASVDSLAVPRFSGTVVVRYPLVTEREALPAQIELSTETSDRLDSVLETLPATRARTTR